MGSTVQDVQNSLTGLQNAAVGIQADFARAVALAQLYGPQAAQSASVASTGIGQVGQAAPGFVQGVQGVGSGIGQVGQGIGRTGTGLSEVSQSVRYASDTVRETRERTITVLKGVAAVAVGATAAVVLAAILTAKPKRNHRRAAR
jgi:hypothetical protein